MRKIKINNIEDLRYRKLYLRSEISVKEQKIAKSFRKLQKEVTEFDFKNDLLRAMMNNPAVVINTARISYELVSRFKRWRKSRNNKQNE